MKLKRFGKSERMICLVEWVLNGSRMEFLVGEVCDVG